MTIFWQFRKTPNCSAFNKTLDFESFQQYTANILPVYQSCISSSNFNPELSNVYRKTKDLTHIPRKGDVIHDRDQPT
jgi:hypothetical protein